MSARFAVVYEAPADFRIATELADRVLMEALPWLEDTFIDGVRQWIGEKPGDRALTWMGIKNLATQARIRAHGLFKGLPGLDDAIAARRAIRYLLETMNDLKAVMLIRDQDDEPLRRHGLEQARDEDRSSLKIIIGFAVVKRECWVLCGFEPASEDEKKLLEAERQNLGFDPRMESHQLTAKDDSAKRSAKRVLWLLSGDDRDRERHCWMNTTLDLLRKRGKENGLAAFLEEIREHLVPLIVQQE